MSQAKIDAEDHARNFELHLTKKEAANNRKVMESLDAEFTPQQRRSLAVVCAIFDEGMTLMMGPQLGCTENEARAFLEELTMRVRDRLYENKDFNPQLHATSQDSISIERTIAIAVKPYDEPSPMTWYDAMDKFGNNGTDKEWRLPTKEELHVIYLNRDIIPNLKGGYYWSSSELSEYFSWVKRFSDGYQSSKGKNGFHEVRCVRRALKEDLL